MKFRLSILMLFTLVSAALPIASNEGPKKVPGSDGGVQRAVRELNQYAKVQKDVNVQNADLAYGIRKALTIADLLLDSQGKLKTNLRASIKSAFISANPKEYETNMTRFLDKLNPSWQSFFDQVRLPQDQNCVSCISLRALFSLGSGQKLTDRHAKVAVLAAMLSPYNQGPVGDCFAVNDVIRDHTEYYRRIAEDCSSIVMKGYIERPIKGAPDYFFFLPILADDDRDQPMQITAGGLFAGTGVDIFDAPGFAAARALMGGDSIANLEKDLLNSLLNHNRQDQIKITPSQLIQALAKVIAEKTSNASVDALVNLGEYAFSSLTNNSILRAVESAFAAMAEDRSTDSTRGNINNCVADTLAQTWKQLKKVNGIAQFKEAFTYVFNACYRLIYNLNIPLAQVSADGSSTDGGFQLYQRVHDMPTSLGTRVATPEQFRQMILYAVKKVETDLGSTSEVTLIANRLETIINSDHFLENVFWGYDDANKQEPDPVQNYLKLSRTPMQSCDGDNPYEVDDIDTGKTYDSYVQSYTPKNPNDLIRWCLKLAKTASAEMIPMDSPQHAFNFMPANPDIIHYVKASSNSAQWLKKTLVIPGMQVAQRQISAKSQKALAQGMHDYLTNALPDGQAYQQLVQNLAQQTLSVQDYSEQLLNGINALLKSDENQAYQMALALDGILLQSLSLQDQAILEQSAVRFAFTNWNEGTKDIYFCAFFNPRTTQIGFGTIFEDKTHLQPMDEKAWVDHQQWDVDLTPFAPNALATASIPLLD
jgi:hypothetical protein